MGSETNFAEQFAGNDAMSAAKIVSDPI